MKKDDAKNYIRSLCHTWREASGLSGAPEGELSFQSFMSWLKQDYAQVLDFRSSTSVASDVELWFEQEFKQTWKR